MEPFLGTVMPVGFNFAPKGWALCNGQLMSIVQNQALFALIGTYFGGNGTTTFALPDLRGRTPLGTQNGIPGAVSGTETVTLTLAQTPQHTHYVNGTTASAPTTPPSVPPTGKIFGTATKSGTPPHGIFAPAVNNPVLLSQSNLSIYGQGIAHTNMQPYLVVNFIIALTGIFPSRG